MVVDDNTSYRQRMVRLLQLQDDFEVVGEASDGETAVTRAQELRPDVVLIDFRMTGLDGYTAARTIVQQLPQVRPDAVAAAAAKLASGELSTPEAIDRTAEAMLG